MWPEVSAVIKEKRHELLISGKQLEKKLKEDDGTLDKGIWELKEINFLSLSNSPLSNISESIGNLKNLTNLVLQGNQLSSLPEEIGELEKLKFVNVSENHLLTLPASISQLSSLSTLNGRCNKISLLPSFSSCITLAHVDLTHNSLKSFGELCHPSLVLLADINLSYNEIVDVSSEVSCLPALKLVDLSNNNIQTVPSEFSLCQKLKEINLKNNKLTDYKLRKIVESDRSLPKHVIDYLKQCQKSSKKKKTAVKEVIPDNPDEEESKEVESLCDRLSVMSCKNIVTITATKDILSVRGFIVCCILRNVNLTGVNLKKFINIQTKLHDGECQRRVAATIATHDLSKVCGPLLYSAKPAREITLRPLNSLKEIDAVTYYKRLSKEAENMRRQNKRNNVSGLYKYLHLVKSMPEWPCLTDANGVIISMPPITNSDCTKIGNETTEVLVEVTSGSSLKKAKEVMEALVLATLQDGLGVHLEGCSTLNVEQVRVVGEDGALRVLYPSRTDLIFDEDEIQVVRE